MPNKLLNLCITLCLIAINTNAQDFPTYKVINGDTIYAIQLSETIITAKRSFENDTARYKYNQMRYNIKKVLPYAIEGVRIFREIDSVSYKMNAGEKRRYVKSRERDIRAKFQDQLKALNITQGRLLVKIMNRQLRLSVYEIIKYLHNPVKAASYRTWAKVNGIDLDEVYDPTKNKDFESIMRSLTRGQ